jgi:hypothetical protein
MVGTRSIDTAEAKMAKVLGFDPYARSRRLHPSMLRHPSMQPAPEVTDEPLADVLELRPIAAAQ